MQEFVKVLAIDGDSHCPITRVPRSVGSVDLGNGCALKMVLAPAIRYGYTTSRDEFR